MGRPPSLFVEVGQRIGKGVVIETDLRVVFGMHERRAARLRCDCGTTYLAPLFVLVERNGRVNTTSCGCARRAFIVAHRGPGRGGNNRKHGLSRHQLYMTWCLMLQRCENPAADNYKDYGGRGIKVCPQWHDVRVFIADIDRLLGPRPKGMTLDRIDVNGDYGPGKVRWATASQQALNRRPISRA